MRNVIIFDKKDLEEVIDFFLKAAGKTRGQDFKWRIVLPDDLKDEKAAPVISFETDIVNLPPPEEAK